VSAGAPETVRPEPPPSMKSEEDLRGVDMGWTVGGTVPSPVSMAEASPPAGQRTHDQGWPTTLARPVFGVDP
jgi:hypothetical protein